ncbi:MAG TPA: cobalamin-dependent protein [Polyangiaceae bacterium]|nr:cobalamin-dependent protein [Polyangiaceae bacterium]
MLSIGALSRATGVPVETLRTWERRYGFPAPVERIDSGHRRYPIGCVERLRLVVRALGLGHKPSIVLPASSTALHDLLALGGEGPPARVRPAPRRSDGSFIERCLDCVKRLDGDGLAQELDRAFGDLGAMEFLSGSLGPFLRALGESWSRGDIEVGHEHFASEYVREFLSTHWRPMSARADGPRIVCAALYGEEHVLGLHMAAMALSLAGARAIFLGAKTRVEDVVLAVREQEANAVALSAALGVNRKALDRDVKALVRALPRDVTVIVGGAGFEPPPPGVKLQGELGDFAKWVRKLQPRAS